LLGEPVVEALVGDGIGGDEQPLITDGRNRPGAVYFVPASDR